ncbi:MAG: EF-P lysine aminoacylase EpmA [Parachlamydiales bacterium]|jgi:lysyl-tRNA synthetase class 2
MSPESKLKVLKDRASMIQKVRSFFYKKKIIEVDPPILVKHPSIDLHIQSIETHPLNKSIGYLHTSPEYTMKRIIASGLKDIYFLGHVFRKNEIGKNHNIEFSMIEWYKSNVSFDYFIKENIALLKLFIKFKKSISTSYFDVFYKNFNLDIYKINKKELLAICRKEEIIFSNEKNLKKEDLLSLLLDHFFEKKAKRDILYIIYDFPQNEAALAKTQIENGSIVAKRFEFYINGSEIANGYFELNDEKVLRQRFEKIIKKKKRLTLDENFLKSIDHIGSCYGIAIGFDRLMMLKHNLKEIKEVLYFSYPEL